MDPQNRRFPGPREDLFLLIHHWADLAGPQIYHLSFYLFAAGTKHTKYPRTGLMIGLRDVFDAAYAIFRAGARGLPWAPRGRKSA